MQAIVTKHLFHNQSIVTTSDKKEIVINLEDSNEFAFVCEEDPDPILDYVNGFMTALPIIVGDKVTIEEIGNGIYTVKSVDLNKGDRRILRPGT